MIIKGEEYMKKLNLLDLIWDKQDVKTEIIKKIIGEQLPEKFIQALAIICEDFSYNCNDFPNFGFEDKEMPKEIKRILMNYLPF